jgi:hypothetical protein
VIARKCLLETDLVKRLEKASEMGLVLFFVSSGADEFFYYCTAGCLRLFLFVYYLYIYIFHIFRYSKIVIVLC